jgi:hypothetical protein
MLHGEAGKKESDLGKNKAPWLPKKHPKYLLWAAATAYVLMDNTDTFEDAKDMCRLYREDAYVLKAISLLNFCRVKVLQDLCVDAYLLCEVALLHRAFNYFYLYDDEKRATHQMPLIGRNSAAFAVLFTVLTRELGRSEAGSTMHLKAFQALERLEVALGAKFLRGDPVTHRVFCGCEGDFTTCAHNPAVYFQTRRRPRFYQQEVDRSGHAVLPRVLEATPPPLKLPLFSPVRPTRLPAAAAAFEADPPVKAATKSAAGRKRRRKVEAHPPPPDFYQRLAESAGGGRACPDAPAKPPRDATVSFIDADTFFASSSLSQPVFDDEK